MPLCNGNASQIFLDKLSLQNPTEFKVMVLDNGAFHKTKSLSIPVNISLIFLPPYSPELNPAEKVWAILKRKFTNRLHNTLDEVSDFIKNATQELTTSRIKSVCGFEYIFSNFNWTM